MALEFPFPAPPAFGGTIEVAPGIHWLRMPLPFALDHINLWLIEEGDGWAIVDTGINSSKVRALWDDVFAGPMRGRPPVRLVVTHFHPDHMGLADWLTDRFAITMEASLAEWACARGLSLVGGADFTTVSVPFYKAAGFGEDMLELVIQRGNPYSARTPRIPASFIRLREGQTITLGGRQWEIIVGEGHSPELAALWCADEAVLISGDQVLPSITPNVGIWPTEPESDQLGLFLETLEKFRRPAADTLVLPSHGLPFRGLHERLDVMIRHHDERLDATLEACAEPITAVELTKVLFRRPLDTHQVFFAMGESMAHLHLLMTRGEVERETDNHGVYRYRRK